MIEFYSILFTLVFATTTYACIHYRFRATGSGSKPRSAPPKPATRTSSTRPPT